MILHGQARLSPSPGLWKGHPDVTEESRRFLTVTVNCRLQEEREGQDYEGLFALGDLQPALQTDTATAAVAVKAPSCPLWERPNLTLLVSADVETFISDISISKQQHLVRLILICCIFFIQ